MISTARSTTLIALWIAGAGVSQADVRAQGAVLRGRVLVDSTKLPIAEATILLVGPQRATTTDSLGRFRLADITPGRHRVLVRRLGFAPFATDLSLSSADSLDVDFVLTPVPQSLSEVLVPTTPISRKLIPFHERRRMGIGHFLDSVDIAKEPGTRLSDKLRQLPGLVVSCRFAKCTLSSSRRPPSLRAGASCPVAFGIDGIHVYDFEVNDLDPQAVAAIEWYAGPAQTPAQFNWTRNTCGVLMIWTK